MSAGVDPTDPTPPPRPGPVRSRAGDASRRPPTPTQNPGDRAGALATAQWYAIDFGSYDYAELDQDFQLVSSHLTPAFASKYKQISRQLRSVIGPYEGSTRAYKGRTSAGRPRPSRAPTSQSLTGSSGGVLMFLDQTVTTTQSTTPRIDRNRLEVALLHQSNGSWLISDLALVQACRVRCERAW
jgi:Mce-associated membrane protein